MKKILGLTVALASVIGFSSLITVNAETVTENQTPGVEVAPEENHEAKPEVVAPTKFAEITAKAKINMRYNPDDNSVSQMSIKFGGEEKASLFNKDATEYGMIVLADNDPLALGGEINDKGIDAVKLQEIKDAHHAVDLTSMIKEQLTANSETVEYYWVIKNTFPLGYEKKFTAAAYEILNDNITISKAKTHSTISIVDEYIKMSADPTNPGYDVVTPVKEVLNNFKANYSIRLQANTAFLYENTKGYPGDNSYDLFVYCWNNTDNKIIGVTSYNDNTKTFTFDIPHTYNHFKFFYYDYNMSEHNTTNHKAQSRNLAIENGKIVEDIHTITINEDLLTIAQGKKPTGEYELYIHAWGADINDIDLPVKNGKVDLSTSYTDCLLVYTEVGTGKLVWANQNGFIGKSNDISISKFN